MPARARVTAVLGALALTASALVAAGPPATAGMAGHRGPISWETGRWQGQKSVIVTNDGSRRVRARCEWAGSLSDTFRLRPGRVHRTYALASTRDLQCRVLR